MKRRGFLTSSSFLAVRRHCLTRCLEERLREISPRLAPTLSLLEIYKAFSFSVDLYCLREISLFFFSVKSS
ncbi:uncharacterized protein J3R85_002310 [Psidium guajava]|nr:uncharacterized protein J3R85_002310 [Psidium guajava]